MQAWGPGSDWALDAGPGLLGVEDSLEGFSPGPGLIRDLHRRFPGLRLGRSRAVFEALVPQVIEQKVTGLEARRAYRGLIQRHGESAPGPAPLRLPPDRRRLAMLAAHEWHLLGVEMRRAGIIRFAAQRADRIDALSKLPGPEVQRRLRLLPGIGAWTAAEVSMLALGDADAVSVGDYHLSHVVAWALAGEPRGSDERMLELLAPYAGHRGRVLRLLGAAGIHAPRFGPRMTVRSIRSL
jgi:3-methyladenine DNA glycosylase/8-oxoguanine DNA glycosylase